MRDDKGRFVKDKSLKERICYGCGSKHTRINKHGNPDWATNKPTDLFLCHNCMHRYITGPKWRPIHGSKYTKLYKPRRFRFKGKRIVSKERVREGECKQCGRNIGDIHTNVRGEIKPIRQTHIHHWFYLVIMPWACTIELCDYCHGQESVKELLSFRR